MLLRENSDRRRGGFTLMEMLVVVAIIVALAGIGGYFLMDALSGSQEDIARSKIKVLQNACDQYKLKHNEYPDSLRQLTVKDTDGRQYIEVDALYDPWKKEYKYEKNGGRNEGRRPDISTISPAPENKEIGNWQNVERKQ